MLVAVLLSLFSSPAPAAVPAPIAASTVAAPGAMFSSPAPAAVPAPCPLSQELGDGGRWLDPEALAGLAGRVRALPEGVCADELGLAIVEENGPDFVDALLQATGGWSDDLAEPWLTDLWAASWFYDHGRREDVLTYSTRALARRLGGSDPLAREPIAGRIRSWPTLARQKYLNAWSAGLGDQRPPPFDDAAQAAAQVAMEVCLADPTDAPADPFDPLGVRQGLGGRLSLIARCASKAILDGWMGAKTPWSEAIAPLLRQYSASSSALSNLSIALERSWGQGTQPGTGTALQPPDDPRPASPLRPALLGYAAFCALALLLSAPRRTRKLGFPLLAVATGLGTLVGVELVLRALHGGPPGVDRPGPELQFQAIEDIHGERWLRDQRGRPFTANKPPHTARLAVVGASSVAGPGLSWPETLPGRILDELEGEVPCLEVLNLGQHGADSTGFRTAALEAARDFDADAVILYGGHNEVAGTREARRYLDLDAEEIRQRDALGHLALWGILSRWLAPDRELEELDAEQLERGRQDQGHHYRSYNPAFEATVDARAERELGDLARGLRRLGTPLIVAIPSFNHHGLRVGRPADERLGTRIQRAEDALLAGDLRGGLDGARSLVTDAEGHPASWNLLSLAWEASGNLPKAEDAIWETSRRNHLGSAVTPGVVRALRDAAATWGIVADAHAALHVAAGPHLPGYDLFSDYVHLNPEGARVVSGSIVEAARSAGLVGDWAARCEGG